MVYGLVVDTYGPLFRVEGFCMAHLATVYAVANRHMLWL